MKVHVPEFYFKSQVCNVVSEIFISACDNIGWKLNRYKKKINTL